MEERKKNEKEGVWKERIQKLCLASTRIEARVASRTHFYGSGI